MVKTSVVVGYETMELAAFRVSPCAFFVVVGGFGVVGGVVVVVVVVVVYIKKSNALLESGN